jgi:UDP-GlcNAc:undecaprenyl-phosphate GlcNAc-1-phosphate transferase
VALISVAVVGGIDHPSAAIALTAAASIVAFLIFNFPTTLNRNVRSFMGDAGSTLLGFTIVWVTLGVSQGAGAVISPVHCLWFAAIPIFDSLTCFVRRVLKGKSPFAPGRDHFHHTLLRAGFGVRQKLSILTGLQALYAIIGILGHFAGVADYYMFAAWSVLGITQYRIIRILARSYRVYRWSQARRHPSRATKGIAHT